MIILKFLPVEGWLKFVLYMVPYLVVGYDILRKAFKGILNKQVFDENFLMTIATVGAFALVLFPDSQPHMAEGAAVMLFYQVGELFQGYAVGKSRQSIADMMDIAPDFANVMRDGKLVQVDPYEIGVGDEIVVKPGERVPLDGTIVEGSTQLDTAALTGESVPRHVEEGAEVISGCVNMTGKITVKVSKPRSRAFLSWWKVLAKRRLRPKTSLRVLRATIRLSLPLAHWYWLCCRRCCSVKVGPIGLSAV